MRTLAGMFFIASLNCMAGDLGLPMHGERLSLLPPEETMLPMLEEKEHLPPLKPLAFADGVVRGQDGKWDQSFLRICAGPKGAVAVGTFRGLHVLQEGKAMRFIASNERNPEPNPDDSPLQNSLITALYFEKSGALWAGNSSGVARIDGKNWFRMGDAPSFDGIDSIYELRDGRIVLGGRCSTLTILDRKNKKWQTLWKTKEMNSWISSIAEDAAGVLWMGALANGILRYDGKTLELIKAAPWLPDEGIYAVHVDKRGNFYVGCNTGLGVRYADGRSQILRSSDMLPGARVSAIKEDAQGRVWAVCSSGVILFDGTKWLYPSFTARPDEPCEDLAFSPEGDLVALIGNDLFRNPQMELLPERPEVLLRKRLAAEFPKVAKIRRPLILDTAQTLWLGLEDGLWSYDGKDWKHRSEITKSLVSFLHLDSKKRLWAGTLGDGLIDMSVTPPRYLNRQPGMMTSYIRCMTEHTDGSYYYGTGGGLFKVSDNGGVALVRGLDVNAIAIDRKGRVWFSDWNFGLKRWDGNDQPVKEFPQYDGIQVEALELVDDGSVRASGKRKTASGKEPHAFVVKE